MYIQPNTTIHILRGVPLSRDYSNTVYYPNKSEQLAAFLKFQKYALTAYSYQRAQLGSVRVQLPYASLYDCNYMIFKNASFENRDFFAFIDGISYINDNVTEIYYTIDVLQTWCYDYSFRPSFIERRHEKNDAPYKNTQPEGLELGGHFNSKTIKRQEFPSYFAFLVTEEFDTSGIAGVTILKPGEGAANYFSGLYTYFFETSAAAGLFIDLVNSQGKTDAVIAGYIAPYAGQLYADTTTITRETIDDGEFLDYTPKNSKLLGYPFRRLTLTNNNGISEELKFECLGSDPWAIEYCGSPLGQVRIVPSGYNDIGTPIDHSIVFSSFPVLAWRSSVFQAWWAQNKNNYLATINAIGRSYDTNAAIAANNYATAERNAYTSATASQNSINAGLANAQGTIQAQAENYQRTAGYDYAAAQRNTPLNVGNIMSGVSTSVTQLISDQNALNSAAAQAASAALSSNVATQNAQLALSTALKNAATTYANSQLSALTSKQNATAQLMSKKQDIQNIPDSAKGNAQCEILNWIFGGNAITIEETCITPEYAANIDGYFTAYGYAQNRMATAAELDERINREHYTYTRTVGAVIVGNMNQQDIQAIEGIYNNGVTTWDTLENVGNYEMEN